MAGKRQRIEPQPGDERYTRRDEQGRFTEQDDVGRAAGQDQKREAENVPPRGQGDRGDREK
jgi:hypothetical protein